MPDLRTASQVSLKRRKAREVTNLIRDNLIDGNAGLDVGARGLLHAHTGEERAAGPRVIAGTVGTGRGVHVVHAAEHLKLVLHGRERLERRAELKVPRLRPSATRLGLDRAVREIDIGHAQRCAGRSAGEVRGLAAGGEEVAGHDDRLKRGQRHAGAESAEEGAAAQAGETLCGGVRVVVVGFHGVETGCKGRKAILSRRFRTTTDEEFNLRLP